MTKLLEKAIKDALKEGKCGIGTKQPISSIKNSKLVIISQSVPALKVKKVENSIQNEKIPIIHFKGSSIMLGKLCGLQFRVSAVSLYSLADTNTQAILKEFETK